MKNSFLDDLCKALENQEPTEDIMKEAVGVGDTELPSQKKAEDNSTGNTEAPGDPQANPVGHPDPDRDPENTDTQAQKDSSLDNADHVRTPGDPNGNPDPTSAQEGFLDKFKKLDMSKVQNMNVEEIAKIAVPAYLAKKKLAIDEAATKAEYDAGKQRDPESDDDYYDTAHFKLFKTPAGSVILCTADYEDWYNKGDIVFSTSAGKKLLNIIPAKRAMKIAAKVLNDQSAEPASEMEGFSEDTLAGFTAQVALHKNRNLIPLAQEKAARDPSGNTGDPAKETRTPVSPSGDTKVVDVNEFVRKSYDPSGHTATPGVNGTPVSKSGDSKELGKNEFEKAADDKDGNPDSPGVDGNPAPSFESFIVACEQLKTSETPGIVMIPENMSMESYAMELGMGLIAAKAMEADLTAAERRALKDSDFGLPEQRKWPIHDETHVRSAITNFHWCPQENQRELAKNILKAIRKMNLGDMEISEANPFSKYCPREWVVARKKPQRKAAASEG